MRIGKMERGPAFREDGHMTTTQMLHLLQTRTATVRHPYGGKWVNPQIVVSEGCTDWTFEFNQRWRLVWVNTYGNLSSPQAEAGQVKDASGVRIEDPAVLAALDARLAVAQDQADRRARR